MARVRDFGAPDIFMHGSLKVGTPLPAGGLILANARM